MDTNLIKNLIEHYHTTPSICKVLGISFDHNRQRIELIAEQLGLLPQLRENNNTSRAGSVNIFEVHKNHGISIFEDLVNGFTMVDLSAKYGLSRSSIRRYVKHFNLRSHIKHNKHASDCVRLNKNSKQVKEGKLYRYKYDHHQIKHYASQRTQLMTKHELIRDCMRVFGISKTTGQKLLSGMICKRHCNKGSNNKMFGIAPSPKAGIGSSGRLVYGGYDVFFRSSLELRVFIHLIDNEVEFVLSNHRIPFYFGGTCRTYNPDIVIGDTVFEIKPSKLVDKDINKAKFQALSEYCNQFNLRCGYITEHSFDTSFFTRERFRSMVEKGYIKVDDKNFQKIMKYTK